MNTQTLLILAAAGGVAFWAFSRRAAQVSDSAATAEAMADVAASTERAGRRTAGEKIGGGAEAAVGLWKRLFG